ncbi:CNNM domain-containing protein [Bdellovibrionota bacterium FG-2]
MTPLELLLCLALIASSAFLSASEVAIFSLSRFQLRSLKDHSRNAFRKIKRLIGDPGGLLVTLLVLNEMVNISLSSIIASAVSRGTHEKSELLPFLPPWALHTLLGIIITTPIVLFACELTPKVIAARANQLIATLTASPLSTLYDISFIPRRGLIRLVAILARKLRQKGPPAEKLRANLEPETEHLLRESDFLLIAEEGLKEGVIQQNELELIRNIFEFDNRTIEDIMTPISLVQCLSSATTVKDALNRMKNLKYSRLPVTEGSSKQVVGVLYFKDLLRARLKPELLGAPITSLMHKPFIIGPTLHMNTLFRKMKKNKTHLAVVQITNQTLGIVTMSDVLDALFEEVLPEPEEFEQEPPARPKE